MAPFALLNMPRVFASFAIALSRAAAFDACGGSSCDAAKAFGLEVDAVSDGSLGMLQRSTWKAGTGWFPDKKGTERPNVEAAVQTVQQVREPFQGLLHVSSSQKSWEGVSDQQRKQKEVETFANDGYKSEGESNIPEASYVISGPLMLKHFQKNRTISGCYDRKTRNQRAIVDSHLHFRPFGGQPVPFDELLLWLKHAGILFVNAYGIGQRLPVDSDCVYYLDCPGTPVTPSLKNDMVNAQAYLDNKDKIRDDVGPIVTMSMSFPDLTKPEGILKGIHALDREYPGMFRWMGEVNLVKQALFNNSNGFPPSFEAIDAWAPFMKELEERNIPIALHADLGSDEDPLKYLPLMDKVLETYPNNTVIWLHLGGLSKQLNPLPPALLEEPFQADSHVDILSQRLRQRPNLMLDLAWDVLYEEVWSDPLKRKLYVELIDKFPRRFLPGTDFVAAITKPEEEYVAELNDTSVVYQDVSDDAFRNIALGENYFRLLKMEYVAPTVCSTVHR